ncbi:ectonucleoside triphosphate diphosphohydrolase 6-like isoform X3 [Salvelinus fontinalis]|uniref:ectonucleoside triphosphate diphosphohydrolase 6-like isoform X3 n=1 Tax=Salvelinus fontinalis TaxID=8038 RepID=UPI00248565B8|nr:ectonucleoside triphosphate diphosphohydrolase 6-like isoform X3 [Salvelinus fontinalis]
MRLPKIASVFVFLGCLAAYLMFVTHHYDGVRPAISKIPPHFHPRLGLSGSPNRPTSSEVVSGRFQYGVMFDAGSTGTRIHVFKFQLEDNEAPKLAHETFRAIKPGLSAYADNPEKCKEGILELLEVAQDSIPSSVWSSTPLVLKATAGLRLLPGEKATHLLDRVREVFVESPFLSRGDSVSIMDGADEGISAWITVNFLIGGLHRSDTPTVGMLDLGGGSTQITFSPQDEKTIQTSPIDYMTSFQMFNSTHTLYSHSYLGLGLMSARLAVLGGIEGQPLEGSSTELVSPCLAPDYSGQWEHAEVLYTVKGQKAGEPIYESCLRKVEKVLYRKVKKAEEAKDIEFYAFSYYYDRAVDLGAIDEKTGGIIKVSDYIDTAKRVNTCKKSPFISPSVQRNDSYSHRESFSLSGSNLHLYNAARAWFSQRKSI